MAILQYNHWQEPGGGGIGSSIKGSNRERGRGLSGKGNCRERGRGGIIVVVGHIFVWGRGASFVLVRLQDDKRSV